MSEDSMTRFLCSFALVCAVAVCSPVLAGPTDHTSWGKASVPLDQYTRDATECAETSRYVTTYIKPKTLRELDVLSSAQLLDTVMQVGATNAMGIVQAITQLRSADDIARRSNTFGAKYVATVSFDVRDQLQAVIDKCLIERGYTRIQLTDSQVSILNKLKRHSTERTAYLHSVDSNATVVAHQRIEFSGK
jgi:hypothetical protein